MFKPMQLLMAIGATLGAGAAFGGNDDVSSSIAAYYALVYAVSIGQADAAIAQFADDAIVVSGTKCTFDIPCVGKAAIKKRYVDDLIARKVNAPMSDQRFDGKRLTTQGEITHAMSCGRGLARLVGGHVFEFSGGRIVSLSYRYDESDAQTARLVACKAGGGRRASLP